MEASKLFSIFIILLFISCNEKVTEEPIKIYHLEPNDIKITKDTISYGGYDKQREDFFVVKNFDLNNPEHRIKIDSFVIKYVDSDDFLKKNYNSLWGLVFFKYGDDITENTKHEYNTDYTIHKLFSFQKRLLAYSFSTKDNYKSTIYYINHEKRVFETTKRKLVEDYFKSTATNN